MKHIDNLSPYLRSVRMNFMSAMAVDSGLICKSG
jgi:hypothetical protein